ncbi:AI-2E family transporter [Petroclostridium sp. X23]|uniref:AI-2E family transporter n=1 Tax=Petroclostridium sp. X23 TaxID=3045146 RepID=UPI0024AD293A|nr:AI-2E family transporter [Petroclostridium sp. X23]WHH60720.1 AI-2E family transporter [Petroclostridium sp. X23]
MRAKYERRYIRYSFYIFLLVTAVLIVYKTVDNIIGIIDSIKSLIDYTWRLLLPFVIGFAAAYLFNPYVMWLERNLFKGHISNRIKRMKTRRLISILLVYVIVLGLITLCVIYIAPKVVKSVSDVVNNIPEYYKRMDTFISDISEKYDLLTVYDVSQYAERYMTVFIEKYNLQNIDIALSSVMKGIVNITTVFLRYILGLIISFYILMEKEEFKVQFRKFFCAILKVETVESLEGFIIKVNQIFSKFIIGKAIDSAIIGVLCFIGLMILDIKYALLISVIIGITNMIPYFGPIIGGIPAVLITLFDSPVKALWVAVFILILQQFDGMVLGPKILGDSIGLSPFWIIFAIIIGGGFFGVAGMFLGVPVVAVIKLLLVNFIEKRIRIKENEGI